MSSDRYPICQSCGCGLGKPFIDLGKMPLANGLLSGAQLSNPEVFFPLRVYFCEECLLVQIEQFSSPEDIFTDYVYFSSWSDSWLEHCAQHSANMIEQQGLGKDSLVVEIASNDGYMLKNFVERGIPCLGVEPAANVAEAAIRKNVPTDIAFFGLETATRLAAEGRSADMIIANNVMAHVPDINDFVSGMAIVLKPDGIASVEFPHLLNLLIEGQFDTIYHEHFSYLSLMSSEKLLAQSGLEVFDVDELPTHGGSLRLYIQHRGSGTRQVSKKVEQVRSRELDAGMNQLAAYSKLAERAKHIKMDLLEFLITAKRKGESVAAYGAAAKGNTLINYCGIDADLIDYVVDLSPEKQGKYLPGSQIPIFPPDEIFARKPDHVLILPWNLKDEILEGLQGVQEWGGHVVVAIPELKVVQ